MKSLRWSSKAALESPARRGSLGATFPPVMPFSRSGLIAKPLSV